MARTPVVAIRRDLLAVAADLSLDLSDSSSDEIKVRNARRIRHPKHFEESSGSDSSSSEEVKKKHRRRRDAVDSKSDEDSSVSDLSSEEIKKRVPRHITHHKRDEDSSSSDSSSEEVKKRNRRTIFEAGGAFNVDRHGINGHAGFGPPSFRRHVGVWP